MLTEKNKICYCKKHQEYYSPINECERCKAFNYLNEVNKKNNSQEIDVVGKPMKPSALKTSGNVTSVTPDKYKQVLKLVLKEILINTNSSKKCECCQSRNNMIKKMIKEIK